MFSRRSFFRRFGAVIAAVALAPEIAFKVSLEQGLPDWKTIPFWTQESRMATYYSQVYLDWRKLALADAYAKIDAAYNAPKEAFHGC